MRARGSIPPWPPTDRTLLSVPERACQGRPSERSPSTSAFLAFPSSPRARRVRRGNSGRDPHATGQPGTRHVQSLQGKDGQVGGAAAARRLVFDLGLDQLCGCPGREDGGVLRSGPGCWAIDDEHATDPVAGVVFGEKGRVANRHDERQCQPSRFVWVRRLLRRRRERACGIRSSSPTLLTQVAAPPSSWRSAAAVTHASRATSGAARPPASAASSHAPEEPGHRVGTPPCPSRENTPPTRQLSISDAVRLLCSLSVVSAASCPVARIPVTVDADGADPLAKSAAMAAPLKEPQMNVIAGGDGSLALLYRAPYNL